MDNEMHHRPWNMAVKVEESLSSSLQQKAPNEGEIGVEIRYIQDRIISIEDAISALKMKLIPVSNQRGEEIPVVTAEKQGKEAESYNSPLGVALREVSQDLDDLYWAILKMSADLEI